MAGDIWMLGDVHGNFDHVLEAVKASGTRPAAVIFLGDPLLQTRNRHGQSAVILVTR